MYYKDITEYPKIFDCYWGQFKCDNISPTSDIIMNRNGFVKEFDIIISISPPPYLHLYMRKIDGIYEMKENPDHIEYYKNIYCDVVITFSAHVHTDDRIGEFKKYKPLYNTSQSSYVCVFPPSLKKITERAFVSINGVDVVLSRLKYNGLFK